MVMVSVIVIVSVNVGGNVTLDIISYSSSILFSKSAICGVSVDISVDWEYANLRRQSG